MDDGDDLDSNHSFVQEEQDLTTTTTLSTVL